MEIRHQVRVLGLVGLVALKVILPELSGLYEEAHDELTCVAWADELSQDPSNPARLFAFGGTNGINVIKRKLGTEREFYYPGNKQFNPIWRTYFHEYQADTTYP